MLARLAMPPVMPLASLRRAKLLARLAKLERSWPLPSRELR